MLGKIRNRTLIFNFSSLTLLQFSNYLFPLISFPYLVRVLGPERYGLVNFVMAFVAYFNLIADYGFNITGTRLVSLARNNREELRKLFWSIFFVRILLMFVGFVVFLPLVFLVGKFSAEINFYLIAFLVVLGTALFPQWFFQGMEKMFYITVVNIFVKIFWLIGIFLFIKNASDALVLIILNAASFLLIGLIGLSIAVFKFRLGGFYLPTFVEIKERLTDGWSVFLSTLSISLYTNSNVFILGIIAGNTAVGYFAAADKIRMAVQGLFANAGQSIFPHMAKLFKTSKEKARSFLRKYLKIILTFLLPVTLLLIFFASEIVNLLLGNQYEESANVLKILAFLPLLIALSNVYGIQVMINTGYKKEFSKIVFLAGILNILLCVVLTYLFGEFGTATAVLIAEFFVTFEMWRFVKTKRILE